MNTVHVMSYIKWYDVKKCGFDALYSVYDVIHIVGVMLYKSGCDISGEVVMTKIQWVRCLIQWCDVMPEVDVKS